MEYQISQRHACRLLGLGRSTHRYQARRNERDGALRARLKELAAQRMRFGYRRLTAVLVREGIAVNHKRVYRLYREEGLAMRIRQRRRIRWTGAVSGPVAARANQRWSIDFVSDCVSTGRVIRMLPTNRIAAGHPRHRLDFRGVLRWTRCSVRRFPGRAHLLS